VVPPTMHAIVHRGLPTMHCLDWQKANIPRYLPEEALSAEHDIMALMHMCEAMKRDPEDQTELS
jgi:hypothetical protein